MMNHSSFDFSQSKIMIFGDLMIDNYWYGNSIRISPEAPVAVVHYQDNKQTLGGAGNVALNIATLGAQATLSGFIGQDDNGQLIQQLCTGIINPALISLESMTTTCKLRILSRNQQLLRVDFEDNKLPQLDAEQITAIEQQLDQQLTQVDLLVLSDYNKGSRIFFPFLINKAIEKGITVIVDPKGSGKDFDTYKRASLLTPNFTEFLTLAQYHGYNQHDINQDESAVALDLIKKLQLDGILITKSEKGMSLHMANGFNYHQNTYATEVFDVTGAGDTVIATLAAAMANGINWQDACYLANKAAGIAVSKLGTATVSRQELEKACHYSDHEYAGSSLTQVKERVELARSRGEKIVFTNGCFDLLHRGHISYLQRARELGDLLIVGVNSDESVKRLKGPSRPMNNVSDRMMMLAALKDVDMVVEFTEDTPLNLIKFIMPDVLVKGGDYQVEDIVGYQEVTANGGRVETISFVEGFSTTNLIKKISTN